VDLQLYFRVLWRFRFIVMIGFLLALVSAILSFATVSFKGGGPHLQYRQHETWVSNATLLVTQQGFPEGRTLTELTGSTADAAQAPTDSKFADPGRFVALAVLYADLVDSDPVKAIVRRTGPPHGKVDGLAVATPDGSSTLPMIAIAAAANTPRRARSLARRQSEAFMAYITQNQIAHKVPKSDRVELEMVTKPTKAKLLSGRSKAVPIVVLVAMIAATLALAFVLENLKPRIREVREPTIRSRSAA
jgi:hypothetical protein